MKKIIYTCALACLFTESKMLLFYPRLESHKNICNNWTTELKEKAIQSYTKYMSEKSALTRVLTAANQGDAIHLWDCSYAAPNNGEYIYNLLKNGKTVPDDISNAPYATWVPRIENISENLEDCLEPTSSTIKKIFTSNGEQKFCDDNYAFIEKNSYDIQNVGPYFIDSPKQKDDIKNIMKKSGAAFVFLINQSNHWFTTVAHKKNAETILYVADDIPNKQEDDYKEPLAWVKEICGFK